MKQPKDERRPLCPLAGFAECRGERCMIWDDDWRVCSLNNGSLYSMVRSAVCDAAVEVAREYVGERELPPALRATSLGEGGNTSSVSPAGCHLPLKGKAWGEADGA